MLKIACSVPGGSPASLAADLKERMGRGARLGFSSLIGAVESKARDLAPVRTGRLRQSIEAYFEGGNRWVFAAGEHYASFICEGTGIYGPRRKLIHIKPRKKAALWWKGAEHPVFSVTIKGIRPWDFMHYALEETGMQGAFDHGFGLASE